ncbi:Malonyl CoA-acyl carrier protein transacylase [Pelomyxa schiedti]|nr:Malonyl CoA-acyl carrier protein transacylase [Pelomyxa schiedti]
MHEPHAMSSSPTSPSPPTTRSTAPYDSPTSSTTTTTPTTTNHPRTAADDPASPTHPHQQQQQQTTSPPPLPSPLPPRSASGGASPPSRGSVVCGAAVVVVVGWWWSRGGGCGGSALAAAAVSVLVTFAVAGVALARGAFVRRKRRKGTTSSSGVGLTVNPSVAKVIARKPFLNLQSANSYYYNNDIPLCLEAKTITEAFQHNLQYFPDLTIYVFLNDNGTEESITYSMLYKNAASVSDFILHDLQLAKGERVLLAYVTGLDFVSALFGCVLAGVIAVPVPPPSPAQLKKGFDHIGAIARDCGAKVGFMPQSMLRYYTLKSVFGGIGSSVFGGLWSRGGIKWVSPPAPRTSSTITSSKSPTIKFQPPYWPEPTDMIALQYTSGSTSQPKGVILTHQTLLHNLRVMSKHSGTAPSSVMVAWVPVFHDMGLIAGVFHAAFVPSACVMFSPVKFIGEPQLWPAVCTAYRATHTAAPNFAYEVCAKKCTDAEIKLFDLSSLVFAINGAEPVRFPTLVKFHDRFSSCGFKFEMWYPHYGLAEHMVYLCGKGIANKDKHPTILYVDAKKLESGVAVEVDERTSPSAHTIVGHGWCPVKLLIVDPQARTEKPEGEVGEIWVSSKCVSIGYWNRPDLSKEVFYATLSEGTDKFLRTGDAGFIRRGELFITGRIKDLIIINGRNIYPQDIELSAEQSSPAIRPGCSAAFSIDENEMEALVVTSEVASPKLSPKEAKEICLAIQQKLFEEHTVSPSHIVLISPRSALKTTSGKIQRSATKTAFLNNRLKAVYSHTSCTATSSVEPQLYAPPQNEVKEPDEREVLLWLQTHIARLLQTQPQNVDINQPFTQFGLTSTHMVELSSELQKWMHRSISPTELYDHPTIALLSHFLTTSPTFHITPQLHSQSQQIAIVGIGCRFPGNSHGPRDFYRLLCEKQDAIGLPCSSRRRGLPNLGNERQAGYLSAVDEFDHNFFSISHAEACSMDPQQRLILETAWETLEDAGATGNTQLLSKCGVFLGISFSEYSHMLFYGGTKGESVSIYAATGCSLAVASNRVSYFLNSRAPSISIDTACSSSLVAVSHACVSLREGSCDAALACGVNILLSPEIDRVLESGGFLSPRSRCHTFDASADGYVRGEGCGAVLLKTLDRALSDGDDIYALILGHSINHVGKSNGLTAPNGAAQEECIAMAFHNAGLTGSDSEEQKPLIAFIEAHGTGTALGDPIEASALSRALRGSGAGGMPKTDGSCCWRVGSVKTNIGHLESAAGIAGIIKTALILHNRTLLPSLHFTVPNPHIPFERLGVSVQTEVESIHSLCSTTGPVCAGVSSFGFGGTNCHVVLKCPPITALPSKDDQAKVCLPYCLLALSAASSDAIPALASRYLEFLKCTSVPLPRVCAATIKKRAHLKYRLAVVCDSLEDCLQQLSDISPHSKTSGPLHGSLPSSGTHLCLVFCGQGSEWWSVAQQLLQADFPPFSEALVNVDSLIREQVGWSVIEVLKDARSGQASVLEQTKYAQPALFSIQVALCEALWKLGVNHPQVVIGHSTGEVVAAWVSGYLSLRDAVMLILARGENMNQVHDDGSMASLRGVSGDTVRKYISDHAIGETVSVAVENSPNSCVISGDRDKVNLLCESLVSEKIVPSSGVRILSLKYAYHSHHMKPIQATFKNTLMAQGLLRTPPTTDVVWISTADVTTMGKEGVDIDYWVKQITAPVRFYQAVKLAQSNYGCNVFLEVSPVPILVNHIPMTVESDSVCFPIVEREPRNVVRSMFRCVAALYSSGVDVNIEKLCGNTPAASSHDLPHYPFLPTRCWISKPELAQSNPLSGLLLEASKECEIDFSSPELSYVKHHAFQDMTLVPGVLYLECALACAKAVFPSVSPIVVFDVAFVRGLFFSSSEQRVMKVSFDGDMSQHRVGVKFTSHVKVNDVDTHHCSAVVQAQDTSVSTIHSWESFADIKSRCRPESIKGNTIRRKIAVRGGLVLGTSFSGLGELWIGKDEAVSLVLPPSSISQGEIESYNFHPAILDACIQGLGVSAVLSNNPTIGSRGIYLPSKVRCFHLRNKYTGGTLISHSKITSTTPSSICGDIIISLHDKDGPESIVAQISGMEWQKFSESVSVESMLYTPTWLPVEKVHSSFTATEGIMLILSDKSGAGNSIAQLSNSFGIQTHCILANTTLPLNEIRGNEINPFDDNSVSRVVSEVNPDYIVFAWTLDLIDGCLAGLLHILQSLPKKKTRLVVLTKGICSNTIPDNTTLSEEDVSLLCTQNSACGMLRCASQEYSENCVLLHVDISASNPTQQEFIQVLSLLLHAEHGSEFALNCEKVWQFQLQRASPLGIKQPTIPESGCYMVTGAFGALGSEIVKILVESGARNIVCLGKHEPKPEIRQLIDDLRKRDVEIVIETGDVADPLFISRVVDDCENVRHKVLCGVVHAAGVVNDKLIRDISNFETHFTPVTSPKMLGAWNLHKATEKKKLDFFIVLSSMASVLGNLGQCNYASANAFVDELVLCRVRKGLPALALNLGPVLGGGMFSRVGEIAQELLESRGILPLSYADFSNLFHYCISSPVCGQLMAAHINWSFFEPQPVVSPLLPSKQYQDSKTTETKEKVQRVHKTVEQIKAFLIDAVSQHSHTPATLIDSSAPFQEFNFDSMAAINISNKLGDFLGTRVNPINLFDYPTIDKLSTHLGAPVLNELPIPISRTILSGADVPKNEFALVGMACRYPKSPTPDAFWDLICSGICAASETPTLRWDNNLLYSANTNEPGKLHTKWGCFVDDISMFDHKFFGISYREATHMDPQQRMLLECTYEALEDAGILPSTLSSSRTAVFVGIGTNDYAYRSNNNFRIIDAYGGPGNALSIAANRISYWFDLKGPSVSVDTACSSSLIALDSACKAMRFGGCTAAIVGGVNALINPAISITFSKAGMLSHDGRCKTFDAAADGYVRGEGCGVVILLPLQDAQRQGTKIYSVIAGSAVNHCGRSNGMTAPSGVAQEACLREAYAQAGIDPTVVSYVEAHGTGTNLGDPIEVRALGNVVGGKGKREGDCCYIGSVKTNIGHLECGSGIAGVIKLALCLHNRLLPPSINYKTPNPNIDFEAANLKVVTSLTPLRAKSPLYCGVSSYGFGGANCHVCMREYIPPANHSSEHVSDSYSVLVLSSKSSKSLHAMQLLYADAIQKSPECVHDICVSASLRRAQHAKRYVAVAESASALASILRGTQASTASSPTAFAVENKALRSPKVVFMFSGQGGWWEGIGSLVNELVGLNLGSFATHFAEVDGLVKQNTGWSVKEVLTNDSTKAEVINAEYAQPILFCLQYAIAKSILDITGVSVSAFIGHSTGEVCAAHMSGCLSLSESVALVVERGKAASSLGGKGKMAHLEMKASDVGERINKWGLEKQVSIASDNSPSSSVVSGDPEAVDLFLARLHEEVGEVNCKVLPVDYAYHSHHMDKAKQQLFDTLNHLQLHPQKSQILWVSTLTGMPINEQVDSSYWADQIRQPVKFWSALQYLGNEFGSSGVFVDIGMHPLLCGYVRKLDPRPSCIPTLKRNVCHPWLISQVGATLHTLGCAVDLGRFVPNSSLYRFISPPRYAWNRVHCWVTGAEESCPEKPKIGAIGDAERLEAPFLTSCTTTAGSSIFLVEIDLCRHPFLKDHVISGGIVLPGTLFIEILAEASQRVFCGIGRKNSEKGPVSFELQDIELLHMVPLVGEEQVVLQVTVAHPRGRSRLDVFIHMRGGSNRDWISVARCCSIPTNKFSGITFSPPSSALQTVTQLQFYSLMKRYGLSYGPLFQGVSGLQVEADSSTGEREVRADIVIPELSSPTPNTPFCVGHPAFLDIVCQVIAGALIEGSGARCAYLPSSYGKVSFSSAVRELKEGEKITVCITSIKIEGGALSGNVHTFHGNEEVLSIVNFVSKRVPKPKATQKVLIPAWVKILEQPDTPQNLNKFIIVGEKSGFLSTLLMAQLQPAATIATDLDFQFPKEVAVNTFKTESLPSANMSNFVVNIVDCRFADKYRDAPAISSVPQEVVKSSTALLALIQIILETLQTVKEDSVKWKLWIVTTNGAVMPGEAGTTNALIQGALRGVSSVVVQEASQLSPVVVDFLPGNESSLIQTIRCQYKGTNMASEPLGNLSSDIVLRSKEQYFLDINHEDMNFNNLTSPTTGNSTMCHLSLRNPGNLDSLVLTNDIARKAPAHNEVEIHVTHAALNFRDVMIALGMYPVENATSVIGGECAGVVQRCGSSVTGLCVGDPVAAMYVGCFASHLTLPAQAVVRIPEKTLSGPQAASILGVFTTAHYALVDIARIRRDDTILIHAGAGGVGLAAIQVAQNCGCSVITTVGTTEKRTFLMEELGVKYVFDSRSASFVEEVKKATNGAGVDVVLNSLSGDLLDASLSLLKPSGRFIEIGKRDVYENSQIGMRKLADNCSFHIVAIDALFATNPQCGLKLLNDVMDKFQKGEYKPLPFTPFRADEAASAFRYMAQAKHIGKVVLDFTPVDLKGDFSSTTHNIVGGKFIITGASGGIGHQLACFLATCGASSITLVSRNSIPPSQVEFLQHVSSTHNTRIVYEQGDISDSVFVGKLFTRHAGSDVSVVHCAGVLCDAAIPRQTQTSMLSVMLPKVFGAWNLHCSSLSTPIRNLILTSSLSSLTGTAGQTNYAAANTFLDILSQFRHAHGLPCTTINLGPISGGAGMFARLSSEAQLQAELQGIIPIPILDAITAITALLSRDPLPLSYHPVVCLSDLSLPEFFSSFPQLRHNTRWLSLLKEHLSTTLQTSTTLSPFLHKYSQLSSQEDRAQLITTTIKQSIVDVLKVSLKQLDTEATLAQLGVDSLIAAELKGKIEAVVGTPVPMAVFLQGWSITAMTVSLGKFIESLLQPLREGADSTEIPSSSEHRQNSSHVLTPLRVGKKDHACSPPVFLVCGAGAPPVSWEHVCNALPGRSIYALHDPAVLLEQKGTATFNTLVDWAEACISSITAVCPEGPIHMGGMSLGGALAACIAEQVTKREQKTWWIEKLVLVDSPPHTLALEQTELNIAKVILPVTAANVSVETLIKGNTLDTLAHGLAEAQTIESVWQVFQTHIHVPRPQCEHNFSIVRKHVQLLSTWRSTPPSTTTTTESTAPTTTLPTNTAVMESSPATTLEPQTSSPAQSPSTTTPTNSNSTPADTVTTADNNTSTSQQQHQPPLHAILVLGDGNPEIVIQMLSLNNAEQHWSHLMHSITANANTTAAQSSTPPPAAAPCLEVLHTPASHLTILRPPHSSLFTSLFSPTPTNNNN